MFEQQRIDEMLHTDAVAFVNAARRAAVRYIEAQGEKRGAADLAHQRSDGAGAAASARRAMPRSRCDCRTATTRDSASGCARRRGRPLPAGQRRPEKC